MVVMESIALKCAYVIRNNPAIMLLESVPVHLAQLEKDVNKVSK